MKKNPLHWLPTWMACWLLLMLSGCGSSKPYDEYGVTHQKNSLSGLSVLRAFCNQSGLSTFRLRGLSERSKQLQTIVWAPSDFSLPSQEATDWIDHWLKSGKKRTLVFIGRDYSAPADYWEQGAQSRPLEDQLDYLLHAAQFQADHERNRRAEREREWTPWFCYHPQKIWSRPSSLVGPWSASLSAQSFYGVRDHLLPTDKRPNDQQRKLKGFRSKEDSETEPSANHVEVLLQDDAQRPLIFRITSEDWDEGQILCFANGSMLLNVGAVSANGSQLMAKVVDEMPLKAKVGFLETNSEPSVRETDETIEKFKGFELLTVWPLNVVSIHAVIFGVIVLIAMFPIFGRPRSLLQPSTQDFGSHVQAMGDLLQRSHDRNFALRILRNYFANVKEDPRNPWARVDLPEDNSEKKK